MKVIGITGGVGAGKSTVLAYLKEKYHACIIQADQVGHLVMEPGGACYEPVIRLFGKAVIKNDKTIDRKYISDVVFSQPELLSQLNGLIHPAVKRWILRELDEQRQQEQRQQMQGNQESGQPMQKLCVVEAALLLEEQYQDFCDTVWYIHTDEEIRRQRLMESRGYSVQKTAAIIASQASEEFFRSHTDYVVENNGNLEHTYAQIDEGIKKYEIM